jgi:excisionase family DNA binding protein
MNQTFLDVESDFFTIDEIAQKLRVSTKTVYKLAIGGALKYTRVGRQYRISFDDYDQYRKGPGLKR